MVSPDALPTKAAAPTSAENIYVALAEKAAATRIAARFESGGHGKPSSGEFAVAGTIRMVNIKDPENPGCTCGFCGSVKISYNIVAMRQQCAVREIPAQPPHCLFKTWQG
jgi:hypothetical protein